jgi:hypothetical protein
VAILKREMVEFFATDRGVFFRRPGVPPKLVAPIRVQATVSVQGLTNKFVVVKFCDYDQQLTALKLTRADFMTYHKFRHALEDAGYEFPDRANVSKRLHEFVINLDAPERWELVDRVGWHGDNFVLPNSPVRANGKLLRFEPDKSGVLHPIRAPRDPSGLAKAGRGARALLHSSVIRHLTSIRGTVDAVCHRRTWGIPAVRKFD